MSKLIIPTLQPKTQPTPTSALRFGMNWVFALIVSALSVFTLAPEGRSAANPATALAATAHAVSTQVSDSYKPDATPTHSSETGTLLSSRSSATLQKLLNGFVDHNPENSDTDPGLNVTQTNTTSTASAVAQQARFYFLVSSIHEAPYSPRSPPYLA